MLIRDYGPEPNEGLSTREYTKKYGHMRKKAKDWRLSPYRQQAITELAGKMSYKEIARRAGVSYFAARKYAKGAENAKR